MVFDLADDAEILKRAGINSASGMALVPGFNMQEYLALDDSEKFEYMASFRDEVFFDKTPQEQEEVLEIAYENLELLKQSGLSVEEISEAETTEVLNMSGRVPSFMAQGGDLLNKGNVRLSTDRRTMTDKQSESWKQRQESSSQM